MAHHYDIGLWNWIIEEAAWAELDAGTQSIVCHVLLEYGSHLRQIKACTRDMRIGESRLDYKIALRSSYIDSTLVLFPRELPGDGHVGAMAYASHGLEEAAEPGRIGIQRREQIRAAFGGFILRLTGAQSNGQVVPGRVQAMVGHLQNSPDIRLLALVEKQIG
jgi:hypothetical protein